MAIDYAAMTPLDRQVLAARQAKPAKYHNHPTEYAGVRYDSKAEAEHAEWLDWCIGSSDPVVWWLRQVPIRLGPDFRTKVDFLVARPYHIAGLRIEAHEIKGVETRDFRTVRRLWPKYGPVRLMVIKSGQEWECIEGIRKYEGNHLC